MGGGADRTLGGGATQTGPKLGEIRAYWGEARGVFEGDARGGCFRICGEGLGLRRMGRRSGGVWA